MKVMENSNRNDTIDTEFFIKKAREIHGNKYDYSLVKYVNNHTKVRITCPIHGVFEQNYMKHCKLGRGCWECGKKSSSDKQRFTTEDFVKKAIKIHGDTYDYSLVKYTVSSEKVNIICKEHGVFHQVATSHLKGFGCSSCSSIRRGKACRKGALGLMVKFKEKHGDFYKYGSLEDVTIKDTIDIECPKHGMFKQKVAVHYKCGCPKCGDERTGEYQRIKPKELDRVCKNIRRALKSFMQKRNLTKSKFTEDVLGCTWADLKTHLENNPYGFMVDDIDLDTDHIVPISHARTEDEVYKLNHYTNLQLLPKYYNQKIKKANPFDRNHFENWMNETNYNKK